MTTTNDKLRSLFLAALMVFSVFAMTVALPGSAAANDDTNYTQGEDYDDTLTSDSTYWQGQTLILTDDTYNSGTYEPVCMTPRQKATPTIKGFARCKSLQDRR